MYTGAPEKCLEVFALKKKKKQKKNHAIKHPCPKQFKYTPTKS